MSVKKLLMIPSDVSLLLTSGKIEHAMLSNVAMANISRTIPIVNDAITSAANTHLSTSAEQISIYTKSNMTSATKNVLIDIGEEEAKIEDMLALTTSSEILSYLNINNQLIYLASASSMVTLNTIDIYYHKKDKCLYLSPELSGLGSPIIFNSVVIEIDIYRVAPLAFLEGNLSSIGFDGNYKYYPDLEFKPSAIAINSNLAEARTDVTARLMLLNGLNNYAVKQEFTRNTASGAQSNNVFTDSLIHVISLDIPASNLLVDNDNVRQGVILHSTPSLWRIKATGKTKINKIVFPVYF